MWRLIVVLAVIAVLLSGAIAAVVIYRLHQEGNIRGSSTQEYTPTTIAKPPATPLHVSWPQYGFDATRDRAVQLDLKPPFHRVWRYYAGSLVEFPPSIAYGRLYFSTNSGKVTAVSTKTGRRAWIYRSGRCVAASPAVGTYKHGTVYAVFLNKPPCNAPASTEGTGKVIAFAAGFGEPRWSKTIGPSESSPLLVGNRLYVGDWEGRLWALDARTGKTIWRYRTGGPIKGAAAFANGRVYVGSYDGQVYCLGAQSGRLVWKAKAQPRLYGRSRFYSTPALAFGRVYIGSLDGRVYSYGAATGRLIWSHSTGGYVYASPAAWNGIVFAGSYSKRFYAFDAATGEVRWTFSANGEISGSPTVIGNVVYFATLERRTYALSARTGRKLWSFPDGKYTPVVAEKGRLFLVGYGRVYGMVPR